MASMASMAGMAGMSPPLACWKELAMGAGMEVPPMCRVGTSGLECRAATCGLRVSWRGRAGSGSCGHGGWKVSGGREKDRGRALGCGVQAKEKEKGGVRWRGGKRILISTGDVMGDIHGAALVSEVLEQAREAGQDVEVYALGGQRMKAAGAVLIGDNTGLSSIGLLEALPLVLPSLRLQVAVRAFLESHPPDVVVLIDYPGVNIPFGKYVKKKFACQVIYYIPPNEWLWNTSRTADIVHMSDTILAVYKGEAEYYAKEGGCVIEVGHPLVDLRRRQLSRDEARNRLGIQVGDIVVALIPASRTQELRHVWPVIADAASQLLGSIRSLGSASLSKANVRFVIPVALPNQLSRLEEILDTSGLKDCTQLWHDDSHVVLAASDLAITKSGSINVELALYNVPQVVVYKIDNVTAWIARNVFRFSVEHVSLVNLILGCKAVPEFIQEEAVASQVAAAAAELLPTQESRVRDEVLAKYEKLRLLLGDRGAATRAARRVLAATC